jgi:transposase-like protein
MPRAYPEEFRHRAVEFARQRARTVSQIAADLGIAQSVLHRWVRQADIDAGQHHDSLTTDEHAELVRLRRANRVLELLDRQPWTTRAELARAIFEWIEGWYNPRRRHTSIGNLSPVAYERRPVPTTNAA